jgi:ATP-dependent Clp protease protease subunit
MAADLCAKLLLLSAEDPKKDITMHINSPGGSFTAMTAIYDTMQYIKPQVTTVCLGQAASAAAALLAAGEPGKRLALPNARILIHQPSTGGERGQASNIEIQANEMMRLRLWLAETITTHSGKSFEEVDKEYRQKQYSYSTGSALIWAYR